MRKRRPLPTFDSVRVIDAGARGKSIAKAPDGRVIFISNAIPGDVVTVQIRKKRKAYYEGVATVFHSLSEYRTGPKCEHFGVCGGCKWQQMAYQHQLEFKQKEITDHLTRIGHLDLPEIRPILGSKKTYHYRNKMEFSFTDQRWLTDEEIAAGDHKIDRRGLGLHIPGRWDRVLDLENCYLQPEPSNKIRLWIRDHAREQGYTFFNPRERKGFLRTLMIRTTSTGEIMVLLQFFQRDEENIARFMSTLKEAFPEIDSLLYVVNTKANDTLYDQEIICFSGKDHIVDKLEKLEFRITAKSFFQTNSEQAEVLYQVVREFAGLDGDEIVYDLYCGTGTIGIFLAGSCKSVVGIETVPEAVRDAEENAKRNGITNTRFFSGTIRNILDPEFLEKNGKPEVLITDPPREGMHKDVVAALLEALPEKIVYVSCNSATQARDLDLMRDHYRVEAVQPVDMFPQTHHVENVVLLKKRLS